MRKWLFRISIPLFFILAIVLMSYPFISNYVFEHRADSLVSTVEKEMNDISDDQQATMIADAYAYNSVVSSGHVTLTDPFIADAVSDAESIGDYEDLLCLNDDGVMGSIEIPCIDVNLPIYHGTSDAVLRKGAGHLEGTSLPVGGESTHSVITGHSGLNNAKLFTDLESVIKGDCFFLHVAGETLAYQVDQVSVVLPDDMSKLQVVEGEDHCTLLTCTPYGINSHRLLVRGTRTDYEEAISNPESSKPKVIESKWMEEYQRALGISLSCLAVGVFILFLASHMSKHHKHDDFV